MVRNGRVITTYQFWDQNIRYITIEEADDATHAIWSICMIDDPWVEVDGYVYANFMDNLPRWLTMA